MGWIKCSERLPEHEQDVLVFGVFRTDGVGGIDLGAFIEGKWKLAMMAGEITHWMELPQPPEE